MKILEALLVAILITAALFAALLIAWKSGAIYALRHPEHYQTKPAETVDQLQVLGAQVEYLGKSGGWEFYRATLQGNHTYFIRYGAAGMTSTLPIAGPL